MSRPSCCQRRDPLVAIDDHVAVRLAFCRHHHDGRLLAALRQRRQQPPLPRRMAHPQVLPTPVELVKLQLHRQTECKRSLADDQYARIKCAPASSAAPVAAPAPAPAGIRANRSAAKDFAAAARIARSNPAGRTCARKKCSGVITLAPSLIASGSAGFPVFDPLPVTLALAVAFLLAAGGNAVLLLRLPSRPFPRLLPTARAAIPLALPAADENAARSL